MARIPMGNFGTVIAQPAPTVRIPAAAFDDGGSGAQKLGDTATHVGLSLMDEQRRQDDALMRARAANAAIDREMAVDQLGREIEEEVTAGRLHYSRPARPTSSGSHLCRARSSRDCRRSMPRTSRAT